MGFEAQDSVRLFLLMAAGAVFAAVGLWLLLRPKPSGSTAKIELFGLKFESSSAGVLVFLMGAAFLAVPLFVPEKVAPSQSVVPARPGEHQAPTSAPSGQVALVLPSDPEVEESEPNDRVQIANQIGLGQTVSGDVRKGNIDWFVVAVPEGPAFVDLRVRKIDGGAVEATLLNAREERIGNTTVYDLESRYIRGEGAGNDRFYVLLQNRDAVGSRVGYEIAVLPVAE